MLDRLKTNIKQNPKLKRLVLYLIIHPVKTRPRWWVRLFQFMYLKRGKGSVIYRSVRKDLPPFNLFQLGKYSVIEDYSCLNNSVGDIIIGDYTRVGLNNTIMGPVTIGNRVNLAQNIVLVGLNHIYQNVHKGVIEQGVSSSLITIGDDTVIGANTSILSGITIGKHCFIGAGSLVNKDIPDYTVAVGNPVRIIKQYDFNQEKWIRINQ